MLKGLLLFIVVTLTAPAWSFYPPDESSQALFASLQGKETEVADYFKSQIESQYTHSNYEVRMTKVPRVDGQPISEWVPVIDRESRKLIIELRITEEALKSPLVMAEEIVNLNHITSQSFNHPYLWAETVANAKAGSIRATEKLARVEVKTASEMKSWLESNMNFFKEGTDPGKVDEWSKLRLEEAQKRYDPIMKAAKKESKRLNDEWAKMKPTFNELEKQEKKLNDYVMANDRVGTRKMIEQYLPWPLMEPSEKNTWKQWLDAMENPDPSRRQLVFRGMDGYPVLRTTGSEKIGMFSSVLAMNQGNYTRRLRSLTTSREKRGVMGYWHDTSSTFLKDQPSLIVQMSRHAGDPVASPFLSVSDHATASRFGYNERMALMIDERRLVMNALAFGYGEKERLIPLVVFPDEVVHYQGKVSGAPQIQESEFIAKVSAAIGRPVTPEEINMPLPEDEFLKRGFDNLSTSLLQPDGISITGTSCVVGLPCDCIKIGLDKLLKSQ